MCCARTFPVFLCLVIVSVSAKDNVEDPEEKIVKQIIKECTESKSRLWCFANKAAMFLERSMDRDIPLLDGIKLVRNEERINYQQQRSSYGFTRLKTALWNFLNTHRLSFDLSGLSRKARTKGSHQNSNNNSQNVATHKVFYYDQSDEWSDEEKGEIVEVVYTKGNTGKGHGKGGGGKYKGGGGDHDYEYGGHSVHSSNKHKGKKEKKYTYYAFMVLLGIFGLTGPLVMKTLAVIAAKALVASKMALIIVGSVLLKKLFEKDDRHPIVKVHTITADHEDEHDRLYSYDQVLPYSAYEHYNVKKPA